MLNFNVKNLLNACQNPIKHISIYRIECDICSYDPEEDTKHIGSYDGIVFIDKEVLESAVQDFEIDGDIIRIYI